MTNKFANKMIKSTLKEINELHHKDFKFFYQEGTGTIVEVRVNITRLGFALGSDNRPFELIIQDIKEAMRIAVKDLWVKEPTLLLFESVTSKAVCDLLGYKKAVWSNHTMRWKLY